MKWILVGLLLVELIYLAIANFALNSEWAQERLNEIRPERFHARWESGWTLWPLKLHVTSLSAHGQTYKKHWQIDTPQASGRLRLWPLLRRQLELVGTSGKDVEFKLRPRPEPERDWSALEAFFPPIKGRDPTSPAQQRPPRVDNGWQLIVNGASIDGSHNLWVYHARSQITGAVSADLTYTTRGGPFSIENGRVKVRVDTLSIADKEDVSRAGEFDGTFAMAAFIPSEHRGLKSLRFLNANGSVSLTVTHIDFLDNYLQRFDRLKLAGAGHLEGVIHWQQGHLVAPTALELKARPLQLDARDYWVEGQGRVTVTADEQSIGVVHINTNFDDFTAYHRSDSAQADDLLMLSGDKLQVHLTGDNQVLASPQRSPRVNSVEVILPPVAVPDLTSYQQYLPQKWRVDIVEGAGQFGGRLAVSEKDLDLDLQLTSDDAAIDFKQFKFKTGLDLRIKAVGSATNKAQLDLSGTQLTMSGVQLHTQTQDSSKPWQAQITFNDGKLSLSQASSESTGGLDGKPQDKSFRVLLARVKDEALRELLAQMNGELRASVIVSDLAWVNHLFTNALRLSIAGRGEAHANVVMKNGWLTQGSEVKVKPKDLQVNLLDYVVEGDGGIVLHVAQGGQKPDMTLTTQINDGRVRQIDEKKFVVDHVDMMLTARAQDVAVGERATVESLHLIIPKANVSDVTAYNAYLPDSVPLRLTRGRADLAADLVIQPQTAVGEVNLVTSGLRVSLDDQHLAGEIELDIDVVGAQPEDMRFQIDGSSIILRDFKVDGSQGDYADQGWAGSLALRSGEVRWRKPVSLHMDTDLKMDNSRPIVALMANQRGKYGWLEKMATVENITGQATVEVNAGQLRVPYAFATSDKVDVGAKGLFKKTSREGMLFARYRKLRGLLKLNNDDRNFDVIGAKRKFAAYTPAPIQLPAPLVKQATQ